MTPPTPTTTPTPTPTLPKTTTMRAVQGLGYGRIDEMIVVRDDVPVPTLTDNEKNKEFVLIQVYAVALAPGDCRVLSGKTKELQGPPSFPYIPGGDVAGIVVQIPPTSSGESKCRFRVGDRIAARFVDTGPRGALGEYAVVSTKVADTIPDEISFVDAAALVSATPATVLAQQVHRLLGQSKTKTKTSESNKHHPSKQPSPFRVLVMGARGGVGSHFCQVLRHVGNIDIDNHDDKADDHLTYHIVGTSSLDISTRTLFQEPICCEEAIQYKYNDGNNNNDKKDHDQDKDADADDHDQDIFTMEKYRHDPFDMIVDFAGYGYNRLEHCVFEDKASTSTAATRSIVKPANLGGHYLSTVPPIGPIFELHSMWQVMQMFTLPIFWKYMKSRCFPWYRSELPTYHFGFGLPDTHKCVTDTFRLAHKNKLRAVLDPRGPFPLTTQGVRQAFHIQQSRHAYGKVVIRVRDEESPSPS